MRKNKHHRCVPRIERLEERRLLAAAILNPNADTYIHTGAASGSAAVLDLLDLGGNDRTAYVRFDLSQENIQEITSAKLTFYKVPGTRNDTVVTGRFDVYGLLNQAGNTPQNWDEATLGPTNVGLEYSSVGGDQLAFDRMFNLDQESGANVSETVSNGSDVNPLSLSGPDLVQFLNERIADDGLATFVSFVDAGQQRGYGYASRENSNPELVPKLEIAFSTGGTIPAKQVERLDRGVVAVRRSTTQTYVGWRLFGDDPANIAFNVYRSANGNGPVKLNSTPLTSTTDFVDNTANFSLVNQYFVRPIIDGVEGVDSAKYTLPAQSEISQRISVPLQIPPPGTTPTGEGYTYTANDASVGDVDGDGSYEIILKWEPTNTGDVAADGYRGNVYIDAYELTGELMWRIDMGQNIRAGAHYTQFMVYDLDGDGRSEVAMRTAPGTIDGQGQPVLMGNDLVTDDYRNSFGVIIAGPEYLTVFDGATGSQLDSIAYEPARVDVNQWGDDYGNRSERHTGAVAYLDGERPSLVFGRGYYFPRVASGQARNEIATYDFRDGALSLRWHFKAGYNINQNINQEYIGQGAHSMTIGDVDGDGRDEIIYGAAAIDDNGLGLYSTGLGHGDALHMSDMDPSRPGQEVFMVHESPSQHGGVGGELRDARTGALLASIAGSGDIGRGVAADIDPNVPGYEMWATTDDRRIFNVNGDPLYDTPSNMFYNFVTWWDADLSRELLDRTTISEWNSPGRSNFDLDPGTPGSQIFAPGASSNNGTKATPALSADILGDWREEVIWRRDDNSHLDIYTTIIPAQNRLYTLMHDTQYRVAIAWQNSGYNQPPHPSFYLGAGMQAPPTPNIYYAGSPDVTPPQIVDVIVASSTWSAAFIDTVDGGGPNQGNGLGVSLPGEAQRRNLPWISGIDRIHLVFSEDVGSQFIPRNVSLLGSGDADYLPGVTLTYGVAGENVGTFALNNAITKDTMLISVFDLLTDAAGNPLDGEWADSESSISGDGAAGGQFNFRFDVLHGDVNDSDAVNFTGDLAAIYQNNGLLPSNLGEAYFDVNSSGAVNFTGDLSAVYALNGEVLPTNEPAIPSPPSNGMFSPGGGKRGGGNKGGDLPASGELNGGKQLDDGKSSLLDSLMINVDVDTLSDQRKRRRIR